jgi:Flp pilus assembly pilin Flp
LGRHSQVEIGETAVLNQLVSVAKTHFSRLLKAEEDGQTMVEYVMLIVLVALAVFIMSPSLTSAILSVFSNTSSALQGPPS